ncbi:MAG: DMT family transporter [Nocardioidaceae bacterium]
MAGFMLLTAAIVTEVAATVSLKLSEGFTKVLPSGVVVLGYLLSFYFLALILARGMSLGIVYAVWSAAGVALIVLVDVLWFDQRLTALQIGGLFCVVLGVAALELGGSSA